MRSTGPLIKSLVVASVVGPLLAAGTAQANFFDAIGRIFGGESSAPPVQQYQPAPVEYYEEAPRRPLGVTVRPRQTQRPATVRGADPFARERPAFARERPARDKRVAEAAAPAEPPNLDPTKNPSWFLQDPTLRRGDIVVLKGEVLVYEGSDRGPRGREDFASLEQSRLSPAEKQQLRDMAGVQPRQQTAQAQPSQVAAVVTAARN